MKSGTDVKIIDVTINFRYKTFVNYYFVLISGGEKEPTGVCPRGYYCPLGTTIGTEFGCPNGTYNDELGLTTVDDCKNCTQGTYPLI